MPWTHTDNHPAAVGTANLRYQWIVFANAERLQQLLAAAKWLKVRVVSGLHRKTAIFGVLCPNQLTTAKVMTLS